jgi:murein DD-endopeptidase MepM/ murein hydrolase activator NlpD
MRYSAIATVLMLATLALSIGACSKEQFAQLIDHRDDSFARAQQPAPQAADIAYKYKAEPAQYADDASVQTVASQDLAALPNTPLNQSAISAEPSSGPAPALNNITDIEVPQGSSVMFKWPVNGPVTQQFGAAKSNGGVEEGIVIKAPRGTAIKASASGDIVYVGAALPEYGQMVIIKHNEGFMSSYAHAQEILVGKGQHVQRGETIAYVGNSGFATHPQLHFTIRSGQRTINPQNYLP